MRQTNSNATPLGPLDASEFIKQMSVLEMILATGLLVGTGGSITIEMLDIKPLTGSGIVFRFPSSCKRRQSQAPFLLPQEQLSGIRRYLSLSISDLAEVLRVERPTVYSWLKGEATPRSGNTDRIGAIYSLAREWRLMSSEPIRGMLNTRYGADTTLLALLSEETIDETATRRLLVKLREALDRVPPRKSVAEIAKERGIRLPVREFSLDDLQSNS
jgi:transcriptional regulator with XRE-family HTH domain